MVAERQGGEIGTGLAAVPLPRGGYVVRFPFDGVRTTAMRAAQSRLGIGALVYDVSGGWRFTDAATVAPVLATLLPGIDLSACGEAVRMLPEGRPQDSVRRGEKAPTPIRAVAPAAAPHLSAVAPIAHAPDRPGRAPLRRPSYPFQDAAVERIIAMGGNCIIAMAMGCGKTQVAIAYGETVPGLKLCICPKSVQAQWADEIRTVAGKEALLLRGTKRQREGQLTAIRGYAWAIISYEQAREHAAFFATLPVALLVCDECHYLKNPQAKRTVAILGGRRRRTEAERRADNPGKLWTVDRGIPAARRLMLSGTPMLNRPFELWPLLNAIDFDTWHDDWHFKERYCGAVKESMPDWGKMKGAIAKLPGQFASMEYAALPREVKDGLPKRQVPVLKGATNLDELHARLVPYYHRITLAQAIPDMPPLTRVIVRVELDAPSRAAYDATLLDFDDWLRAQGLSDAEIAKKKRGAAIVKLSALRQQTTRVKVEAAATLVDPLLGGWGYDVRERAGGGVTLAADGAPSEERESVLVFSTFVAPLKTLEARYGATACRLIIGDTPDRQRDANRTAFQAGHYPLLALTHAAGGVGLNLQRARLVVIVNEDWTPAANEQAIARAYRNGQKRGVTVYTLIAEETVDAAIHELVMAKQEAISQVMDGRAADVEHDDVLFAQVLAAIRQAAAAVRAR